MKRIIVDFNTLTPEILGMLVEKHPEGYGKSDIIKFKNAAGETIEAVEVKTEDVLYLIKVSKKLEVVMDDYDESDYEGVDPDYPSAIEDNYEDEDDNNNY